MESRDQREAATKVVVMCFFEWKPRGKSEFASRPYPTIARKVMNYEFIFP